MVSGRTVAERAVLPLALAGMVALAGIAFGRIYADALLTELVAGAAILSVAIGTVLRRRPSWMVAPISVALLAGYTLLAVTLAPHQDPLPRVLADALGNGIPRLLTALIPIESTPDTVVVPVIAAWLAGLAGTEIALRGGRVLLGCLPATALFAGALYVIGPNSPGSGPVTLAFAGLVVVALVKPLDGTGIHNVPGDARAVIRVRALAGAGAGLTVVVALIALIAPWVGSRVSATPVDPRRYVQPPRVDSLDESPLNRISGWALTPGQKLLEVRGNKPPTGTRLRLAVLPDYDGVTWRVGATYRNAGRILPTPADPPDTTAAVVRERITVDGLTGRLLPALPVPTEVSGARVAYDPGTGTLIRPEGLAAGLSYAVTSRVQSPDPNLLGTAEAPSGAAVARYLAVGAGVPESIQRLADRLSDGNGGAYDRASAIEDFLAEHYRREPDAPSGHAYPNLQFFLFGPRDQGGQRGTSEQFAAAYALLARLTGLPSRVVVGFTVPPGGGTVTAADALAWPEVLFDGPGWVPFDPMPKDNRIRPVEEDFTPEPPPPPPSPTTAPTPSESASTPPPALLAAHPGAGPSGPVVASASSGSALLVLAGAAYAIVVMRRRQRYRRLTTGTPDDRVAGAWYEFTDALRLAGRPLPPHLDATAAAAYAATVSPPPVTPHRTVTPPQTQPPPPHAPAHAAPHTPRRSTPAPLPPLDALIAGVNATTFGPGGADPGLAHRAGSQAVTYADALRDRLGWWRRAWWRLHPGPLRWHR